MHRRVSIGDPFPTILKDNICYLSVYQKGEIPHHPLALSTGIVSGMLDYNKMERLIGNNGTGISTEKFARIDYIKITILGFGLSALWACLHGIISPLRLLNFIPEVQRNTYLDLFILTGLFLAMIVQPIAGAINIIL